MSGTPAKKNDSSRPVAQKAARPALALAVIIVGVLCAAGVLLSSRNSGPRSEQQESYLPETQPAEAEPSSAALSQSSTTELLQNQASTATGSRPASSPQVAQTAAAQPPAPVPTLSLPHSEPSPYARQLASTLSAFDASTGPLTSERAGEWKQTLQQLVQQGAAGAAAIREYLEKNTDWVFGADAGKLTGYDSVRKAMFDALGQIGGPEALGVVLGTLQTTADPKEIALLAKNLAQLEPEQHQAEVLSAVHDALAMAADKNLEGADVGPLFEVLQKYGGAISQLEQATGQWKYYATMALAQLPDGAGIPSLKRMVQDPNGADAALQMLAQMSAQYPEARAVLLDQVHSGKIAANIWPYLISPLAGDQFQVQDSAFDGTANLARGSEVRTTHISYGNQNVISAPDANLTPAQIDQQMKLVDELMAATSDPAALKALQQSKDQLSRRQQLVHNASPTPK